MMSARNLRILLVASVAVNLFLGGALVGGALRFKIRDPMIMAGSLRIAGSELPPGDGRAFRAALRQTRSAQRSLILQSQAAKTQAAHLLRAPQLDEAAVTDALDSARTADMAIRKAIEERAVVVAAALSAGDRTRLADAMERRVRQDRRVPDAPP